MCTGHSFLLETDGVTLLSHPAQQATSTPCSALFRCWKCCNPTGVELELLSVSTNLISSKPPPWKVPEGLYPLGTVAGSPPCEHSHQHSGTSSWPLGSPF